MNGLDFLWPPAAKRATALPALPGTGNATLWDDICDILLDPEPDQRIAETIHRWLREQVEQDLQRRLKSVDTRAGGSSLRPAIVFWREASSGHQGYRWHEFSPWTT